MIYGVDTVVVLKENLTKVFLLQKDYNSKKGGKVFLKEANNNPATIMVEKAAIERFVVKVEKERS